MKIKKFDIFNTFEIFNAEALSIITERIIKFVLIEADNFFINKSHQTKSNLAKSVENNCSDAESCLNAEVGNGDIIHLSVLNNKKVYNLLTNTWRKYQQRAENENIKC